MAERFGRIEEARGSIPLTSTPAAAAFAAVLAAAFVLAACASGSAGGSSAGYEGLEVADPRPLPAMVLTDTSGEPFDLVADTAGSVRLLFFGFTHCPDICNIQLAQLQQVLARPGAPANVDLLFVTVDPERDTPAVIRAYLDRFSTDFVGLVAEPDQLTRLANEVGAYAAVRQYDTGSTTPAHDHDAGAGHGHDGDGGAAGYEVGHDARVFAFAPDGVGYTQYPHPTRQSQYDHDLPLLAAIGARA